MAYHYAHDAQGNCKTITTATLQRHRDEGWQIFNNSWERDNSLPNRPWTCNFETRALQSINPSERGYYTSFSTNKVFDTKAEAQAALDEHPLSYGIDGFTGTVYLRRTWLPANKRTAEGTGEYATEYAAREALNAFRMMAYALVRGDTRWFFPNNSTRYTLANGFVTGKTLEECKAKIPLRYSWNYGGRNYNRAMSGEVLVQETPYRRLRAALRGRWGSQLDEISNAIAMSVEVQEFRNREDYSYEKAFARVQEMTDLSLYLCADCERRVCDGSYENPAEENICRQCNVNYRECAECETREHSDEMFYDREEDCYYCQEHRPAQGVNGKLQRYSDNVLDTRDGFKVGKLETKPDLWLGFELEVYAKEGLGRTATIKHVQETSQDWGICKADGSIGNGFELVSIPATLAWHQENIRPWLQENNQHIEGWSHEDCGMHVHVGREQLTELTLGKLVVFMHERENQGFITHIAGRDVGSYCQRGRTKKALPSYRLEDTLGRYQALNFSTRNKATIEFRIFRSNVAAHGFMRNLEFVHAVCSWARDASILEVASQYHIKGERGHRGHKAFIAYVAANRRLYPSLVRWLENAKYLELRIRTLEQVPERHREQARAAFLIDQAA